MIYEVKYVSYENMHFNSSSHRHFYLIHTLKPNHFNSYHKMFAYFVSSNSSLAVTKHKPIGKTETPKVAAI